MHARSIGAFVALATAVVIGFVGLSDRAHAADDAHESAAFTIDDLAFFAGHWEGELFGGQSEEAWMSPRAGTMLGSFRLMFGDQSRVIEFLMITQTDDGVVFRFKHFNSDYTTWEKESPLIFDLVEVRDNYAVFESTVQTKPKRMIYQILEDGRLSVTVESEENGESESFDAIYSRVTQ